MSFNLTEEFIRLREREPGNCPYCSGRGYVPEQECCGHCGTQPCPRCQGRTYVQDSTPKEMTP